MEDRIGAEVQHLYAEYPYPNHGVVSSKVAGMLRPAWEDVKGAAGARTIRILDAGCGTGENALGLARAFPEAEVTGIDLNKASLDRAVALAQKSGLEVRFVRRNLMESYADLGTFDLVVSVGVMHHLADPHLGLKNLREVAAAGAPFLGMLYGYFGKWEHFQARDALEMLAGSDGSRTERLRMWEQSTLSTKGGPAFYLQKLLDRRRYRFGPGPLPLRETVQLALRRRNARVARAADQLTHTQELVYTWDEIAALLDECGWSFRGWPPRSGMPDSPSEMFRGEAVERLNTMSPLEQARIYERLLRPVNLYFMAAAS